MNRLFLDRVQLSSNVIPEGLICVYCKRLLFNPLQSKCGHRFCEECQGYDLSYCPKCNYEINEVQYDYGVNREINDFVIKCPMEECALRNGVGKVSDHLSKCSNISECSNSRESNCSDSTIDHGDLDIVSSLDDDINEEVRKMKISIDVLTHRTDEVNSLSKRFESLRSMVNISGERNEKNMKNFIKDAEENYRKIEMLITESKSCRNSSEIEKHDCDLQSELSGLKEKYISIEENLKSQNVINKSLKENLAQLYSKIKFLEDKKKENFNQYYEEVEYLAKEFSILKTVNEKKVIQFYNKIDRNTEDLRKVATSLPELFQEIKKLKKKGSKIKKYRADYNSDDLSNIGKEISEMEVEIRNFKETVNNLTDHYPSSVFVTVFFHEEVGMNMSLRELEIFTEQFETTLKTMKKEMSFGTESNRSSLLKSKIILRRRSAFNISDRKKKSELQNTDEK